MIKEDSTSKRELHLEKIKADLVVVGGGIAGVCCAITAARAGIKVVLVQDRPVLGGNSSSEVRLWVLGATSHMGNNNRWSREGGVMDELLVENTYRNKEGNAYIWDTILLEKVVDERNITLLLNTSIYEVNKDNRDQIKSVVGFCSQNSTKYELVANYFCDASGDGIVSFLAGASFRMGAEPKAEFGELCAPNIEDYGELLGHSIFFYSKDTGQPIKYVAPSYALKNAGELPKIRNYSLKDQGCRLWWVEFGGRMDTVLGSETIKWELWKIIYGIWDYVKNSGEYPEAETYTLEWVGTIPGKRESRRFIGDYMLRQQDIVEQKLHDDAVAFGGWAIDLHPADGVYGDKSSCTQWHSRGIYQIPYRCYYSKDIRNLFFAGRIISVTHVAFGSTRVMATCGLGGQVVGMAAAIASKHDVTPRDLLQKPLLKELQNRLGSNGQSIPGIPIKDQSNLTSSAKITGSSTFLLDSVPFDGPWQDLEFSAAQIIPLQKQTEYTFTLIVRASQDSELLVQLRTTSCNHYTPDIVLESKKINLNEGVQDLKLSFSNKLVKDGYGFLTFLKNEHVSVKTSTVLLPGTMAVFNKINAAVSNFGKQSPPDGIGIDEFEFWCPNRRPHGHNLAFKVSPSVGSFEAQNVNNGFVRPSTDGCSNAWIPSPEDEIPAVTLQWDKRQSIRSIKLFFDTDFDHAMESVLMGHPENVMPLCVRNYSILDREGNSIFEMKDNYQTINHIKLEAPLETDMIVIMMEGNDGRLPVLYEVLCYE